MKRVLQLLFLLWAPACLAQSAPPPTPLPSSVLGGYATLAVTSTTANVTLPAASPPFSSLTIYNSGAKTAYFNIGAAACTAATSNTALSAGTWLTVWVGTAQVCFAAITGGTDTTTIQLYQANGPISFG